MDWDERARTLDGILTRYYPLLVGRGHTDAEADLGRAIPFDAPGADAITAQIGAMAQGITTTQRDRIAGLINTYSGDRAGLVAALQDQADYTAGHAALIAADQVGRTYNQAIALAVRSDGHATCYVTDGDGDDECAALNGTTQTPAWCLANPKGHPNCKREIHAVDAEK